MSAAFSGTVVTLEYANPIFPMALHQAFVSVQDISPNQFIQFTQLVTLVLVHVSGYWTSNPVSFLIASFINSPTLLFPFLGWGTELANPAFFLHSFMHSVSLHIRTFTNTVDIGDCPDVCKIFFIFSLLFNTEAVLLHTSLKSNVSDILSPHMK